ncbi:carbamoyltransferase HypF [Paludibaculum fermentans]|uniref:Carbamoyltransferase n=1 Tax=Paludibaculum fermentans TaxID=1473598 RepID=A0A7S7NU26_PALFE|nr:carbamoyltransferase HypF [Paludibaculum fermentans]QOY89840.1 carbamoyltransferase HypF [Paludibaculum fermentans]
MRLRIRITGAVQGVGFRPHVYRLAASAGLGGFVQNSIQGVLIEAEGPPRVARWLEQKLRETPPANAVVHSFISEEIPEQGITAFRVDDSDTKGEPAAFLLPDLAICPACLADIRDPGNRRYRYPFTTCTHCGPRYSIVEGIPYDRPLTSMRRFPLCPQCEDEYRDPRDRRFHAQTNCCPACGPQLSLWSADGTVMASRQEALSGAVQALREGRIVAIKGIGGFHLCCNARDAAAIRLLRERKHRPTKPFAVMTAAWHVRPEADRLLRSPQAPIVLIEHRGLLPDEIAPGNPYLGLMSPYSPLHALLLDEFQGPMVATSGNLTDEPICFDESEALQRLAGIADVFLIHDRPIVRPVDDSIVRFIDGQAVLLRRARGYAPLPFPAPYPLPDMLATGAHMKNTVAFSRGNLVFLSQHLGDLETVAALENQARTLDDLRRTYQLGPRVVACDLHPDYGSTHAAQAMGLPVEPVQHHEAHVLAGILEHRIEGPVLGVAWDGTGYGHDKTIWGGEFLVFQANRFTRAAHLRPFRLPGGDQAVREPRRSLLGVLHQFGRAGLARPLFQANQFEVLQQMLVTGLNSPVSTSAGRLFDAAAALLGLCPVSTFEGEAAMLLEFAARRAEPCPLPPASTDWQPLFEILANPAHSVPARAACFHHALAGLILQQAQHLGIEQVLLTGGCFQNAILTELAAARLREAGFRVFTHQAIPPNDGAIAAGQILAAALRRQEPSPCA